MGQLESFAFGVLAITAFIVFGAFLYSTAATESNTAEDFALVNQSQTFLNNATNTSNVFLTAVKDSQTSQQYIPILSETIVAGSAIVQAILFLGQALNLILNMVNLSFLNVAGSFGIPSWVLSLVVAAIGLFFAFGVVKIVLRYDG